MLIPLIVAILQLPSTGNPGFIDATVIAWPIARCAETLPEFDGFDLVALAKTESGFRPNVENGRMVGLFQLNARFIPRELDWKNPADHVAHWCERVSSWRAKHARCSGSHPLLGHHFSGNVVSKRGANAARRVLRLGKKLRGR